MSKRTINLLPLSRQKVLEQEYWVRFGTIVLVVATWLVVIAGVLLIPSYVFLNTSMDIIQRDLANVEHTLSSSDEKGLLARLKVITEEVATLRTLKGAPSASQTLRTVLAVPHLGISLTGLVYIPAAGKVPRSISISGQATRRDALRQYQIALQGTAGIASAELPVSAYAKDIEIPFTIQITFLP